MADDDAVDQGNTIVTLGRLRYRMLEAIIAATPDLIYAFDLNHRFIFANDALLAMWGKTWNEAVGRTCLELGYEPWHAAMHDGEIDEVVATGRPIRGEVPFLGTNGRRIYDYIFVPVFDDKGEVEAVAGTTRDVSDRKQVEEHRELLTNELQHRVKNTLSVVQAIARQSFGSLAAYGDFSTRLKALATGLDILTQRSWSAARLHDLVESVLATHQTTSGDRIRIHGPDILVRARSVVALSLALSELATNAAKYGSLSNPSGSVDVEWATAGDRFQLVWRETGGPLVLPPSRTGFGSLLIRSLATEFNGCVELDHRPEGVVCVIESSLKTISEG
ncbi:MAG: HWE histidine kinase domain-containing protein [Hyphomicrobiaceae bacterium]|nr:HWE histidine kinase domain-containing protein [Hyphomicrobiaceae bacterium]